MYLKKLELNGFKSFATKTALDFLPDCPVYDASHNESGRDIASDNSGKPAGNTSRRDVGRCGITAIVGPNGSGKSNVADAIRWAIGEQSSKNLRGKKSEDVIFAGTEGKARLGTASVTLYFDNTDKRIPIEFSEVAITRKVHRDGEGEYLINGSRVRLLDVVDLLAKAGVGRDSYCVITQGMSDAVLNATPLERRAIFEDAAGVKPYQIEKERALRKLESTRENLVRVDSLVIEIEPHLRNLRRQAEKASQAKDIALKLRAKQELLYSFLWHTQSEERGSLIVRRTAIEEAIAALEHETVTLEAQSKRAATAMETNEREDAIENELGKLRAELNVIIRETSVLEGRQEAEREKQREREEIEIIPVDLPFVQARLEEIAKLQAELIDKLAHIEQLEDLQDIREFATVVRQRIADLRAQAGEGSVKMKKVMAISDTEREATAARLAEIESQLATLHEQARSFEQRVSEKNAELATVRESGKAEREAYFAAEKEFREKEHLLQRKKDELNDLKVGLARVEVREEDLTALIREELSLAPEALQYDGTLVEREKLEREVARLKVEVEHVGTIDPLVVDEFQETEKRFTFLSTESEDLKKAAESLKEVIKEMDHKIDAAFKGAFKEIDKRFAEYFKIIFGGGKASLEIVRVKLRKSADDAAEDEDELGDAEATPEAYEVGIEIAACPPGKRIHNLSMLSGGERSLTSLALLFAIISHNPPPFAVLDEVEAALDEANSRRFSKMLAELSEHTQFIAITHNRETMAQAGLIYGVTMAKDGVSKLLSIRLDQVGEGGKVETK
ncbi:MAG: AAA family ATPase [Candidatus Moraniibacteriota bacterium]|nr:MAG: AAA family ATPase [Candidatus Moranbacteria bacterium]